MGIAKYMSALVCAAPGLVSKKRNTGVSVKMPTKPNTIIAKNMRGRRQKVPVTALSAPSSLMISVVYLKSRCKLFHVVKLMSSAITSECNRKSPVQYTLRDQVSYLSG